MMHDGVEPRRPIQWRLAIANISTIQDKKLNTNTSELHPKLEDDASHHDGSGELETHQ